MDPAGKVALVTGGAAGLGLVISKELLKEGAKGVSMCDVDTAAGEERSKELQKEYGENRVIFLTCDVTKMSALQCCFEKTQETFGCLDIVINNAGIFDDVNWDREIEINLKGVIHGLLLAYKFMGKNEGGNGGVVINVASLAGITPAIGLPFYTATKYAVIGLTRTFGFPMHYDATGVRVMAMCPGVTVTNINADWGSTRGLFDPSWAPEVMKWSNPESAQSPECVSIAVLHIIREGKHGSVWVSYNNLPALEVKFPHWEDCLVK